MADLALKTTNASTQTGNNNRTLDVEESFEQMTLLAAADMGEGAAVYVDSNGKFALADASGAGTADVYGITVRKVKAGEPVTAIAKGIVGGFVLTSQAYGAAIYLSDTNSGILGDAAGTVSVRVGTVVPAMGQPRGGSFAKLLRINL
jgi:hypothetical protein